MEKKALRFEPATDERQTLPTKSVITAMKKILSFEREGDDKNKKSSDRWQKIDLKSCSVNIWSF